MTAYGGAAGATGILFNVVTNPYWPMPAVGVADLGTLPGTVTGASAASAWTSGWPDGGPQFVAGATESLDMFKQRIINTLIAAGTRGVVVNVYCRNGFFENNNGSSR